MRYIVLQRFSVNDSPAIASSATYASDTSAAPISTIAAIGWTTNTTAESIYPSAFASPTNTAWATLATLATNSTVCTIVEYY